MNYASVRKHRQVLLNSAHFLRLYNQTSTEAVEMIKNKHLKIEKSEPEEVFNHDDIASKIISENGLRLLWDALANSEILRASLLLEYMKTHANFSKESLEYFESQLLTSIINILSKEQADADFVGKTFAALKCKGHLIEYLKLELSKDALNGLNRATNVYKNLKTVSSPPIGTVYLFIESESNFCEYSHLKDIKYEIPENSLSLIELKETIKNLTADFLTKNLDNLPAIDPDVLNILECDEGLAKTIMNKSNEAKLKGTVEKLKIELVELFDRLMKVLQSSIRSNSIAMDEVLNTRFMEICEHLKTSDNFYKDLEDLLKSLHQSVLNKSNIIFTIHKNELMALNSNRQVPIPSKLYFAVRLCNDLISIVRDESNCDSRVLLVKEIEQLIIKKFYEMWFNDISSAFIKLRETNNELFALSWLSDSFLVLQVSEEDKKNALGSLNINLDEIKVKYFAQAALLAGLLEPEKIPTPKLQAMTVSESTSQLLPHFISL